MASNLNRNEDHHHHQSIRKWEVNKGRLALMHQKMSTPPQILSQSAGRSSCSIYRVPQTLVDINGSCYQPHIVSIGPYHHGSAKLHMIQEHKWRFLGLLLKRAQIKNLTLEDLLVAVQPLEAQARDCYSETLLIEPDEFIEILVLDGCFIIELFRKMEGLVPFERDDPLMTMTWIYSFFLRDLIRLENQIPFFVLECLFELTKLPGEESGPTLATLTLNFFNNTLQRPDHVIAEYGNLQGKHILDFLRSCFIPREQSDAHKVVNRKYLENGHVIQSITNLRRAGITLKPGKRSDSFLVIKFKRGVIEMPTITLDDFMGSFLLNCVAYEQCHTGRSKHMTTYATLLDCLIHTTKDVEYLSDCDIIENYFGTDAEVAKFINNMGKEITFDINSCYLSIFFNEVNKYYHSYWHFQWTSFKFTYFRTPWSFVSACAAFILLVLTILQTLYTILSYVFRNS